MATIEKLDSSMIVIREPGVVPVPRQIPPPWRQNLKKYKQAAAPRQADGRATDGVCQFNDQGIPNVGDLAVEIKGNNELFASPVTPRHRATNSGRIA
jgi:hypothetical protein